MKDIRQLLKQRDNLYRNQTIAAFDSVHEVLEGVEEYLSSVDPSYGFGTFEWEEIAIHEQDGLLMLLGFVNYEPNQEFLMGGELVEITDENVAYFQRVLRINIPIDVALADDKERLIQFLVNLNNAIQEEDQEAPPVKLIPDGQPETNYDFDLDELTDEQKAALMDVTGKLN